VVIVDLNGEWLLQEQPAGTPAATVLGPWLARGGDRDRGVTPPVPGAFKGEWLPAIVPGEIHQDLVRAGRLPDPYFGDNEPKSAWVHERDWWLRRSFTVTPETLAAELVFDGIDTFATIFLNHRAIGTADNMFRQWRFDVRRVLRPGVNELVVCLHAPNAACEALAARFGDLRGSCNFAPILHARKAQYSAGWDWGACLTTIGLWKPVRLEAWTGARPGNVRITTTATTVHVESDAAARVEIFDPAGQLVGTGHTVTIPQPQLWWPAGYGEQPLYRAVVDGREFAFGFRTVRLERESFRLEVNGVPIFCKGANWIPAHPANVAGLLERARAAGMNMLRVWGGGVYESDEFYRHCDRLGILVWQDFPFCYGPVPEYAAFRENVIAEVRENIARLRNHPSLALWCGNNETQWYFPRESNIGFDYFHELLPALCAELNPDRPYWPGSPWSDNDEPNSPRSGNQHNWEVFFKQPDRAYLCSTPAGSSPSLATPRRRRAPPSRNSSRPARWPFTKKWPTRISRNSLVATFAGISVTCRTGRTPRTSNNSWPSVAPSAICAPGNGARPARSGGNSTIPGRS